MASVLFVEPDLRLAKLCRIVLHEDGHETTFVTDGNSALLQLRFKLPDVMVVDLDVFPDGPLFWRSFRDMDNRPLLLILASFDARALQERHGAEGSLAKPFDPTELSQLVEELPNK